MSEATLTDGGPQDDSDAEPVDALPTSGDHPTEGYPGASDHKTDHKTGHGADRSADGTVGHGADGTAGKNTDHRADRDPEPNADRSADRSADQNVDHGIDEPADKNAEKNAEGTASETVDAAADADGAAPEASAALAPASEVDPMSEVDPVSDVESDQAEPEDHWADVAALDAETYLDGQFDDPALDDYAAAADDLDAEYDDGTGVGYESIEDAYEDAEYDAEYDTADADYPPERPRTSGVAAMVFGVLAVWPLSVLLALVALIPRRAPRRRWPAYVALVLSAAWIAATVVFLPQIERVAQRAASSGNGVVGAVRRHLPGAPGDSGQGVFALKVGDCFNNPPSTDQVNSVPTVPCGQPHDSQIFAEFDLLDGQYPPPATLESEATDGCRARINTALDRTKLTPQMKLIYLRPQPLSWMTGHHGVSCYLFDQSGTVTGSLMHP